MNVPLLRKIEKVILKEPLRYNQNATLVKYLPGDYFLKDLPPCGTVGCIAGWACALTGKTKRSRSEFNWSRAQKVLKLTKPQSHRLFPFICQWIDEDGYGWPKKFVDAYFNAKTPLQRARVAVRRIEHFIKTKGKE